ncbi:MAG: hypothetical protein JWN86_1953 [Planctomycetota bacterium]|nr:hypothetical protein [Planctomycetota bacterium]
MNRAEMKRVFLTGLGVTAFGAAILATGQIAVKTSAPSIAPPPVLLNALTATLVGGFFLVLGATIMGIVVWKVSRPRP